MVDNNLYAQTAKKSHRCSNSSMVDNNVDSDKPRFIPDNCSKSSMVDNNNIPLPEKK